MKLLVGYIWSFCLIVSAMVPCSFFDHCEDEVNIEQQACTEREDHECKNCSPFSFCSPQQAFFANTINYSAGVKPAFFKVDYHHFIAGLISGYHPTLLQPPRC